MTPRLVRTLCVAVATLAVATGSIVATAPAAVAAPVFQGSRFGPVVGDLTGDAVADRLTLGDLTRANGSRVCAYQLARGLGGGRFATPTTAPLPVVNPVPDDGILFCPDLGTVLKGPTAPDNQLAATWYDFGPYGDVPQAQTFKGFGSGAVRNTGGFPGLYQASLIRSLDFDGDGYGDAYEYTDQGGPYEFFVGRNHNWRQLDIYPPGTLYSDAQFFDLNHNGGTDIVTDYGAGFSSLGVAVVDGRSGAKQVIAQPATSDPYLSTGYTVSVIDYNHDTFPDLSLTTTVYGEGDPVTTHQVFVNQSKSGRWYFRPLPPA